MHLRPFHMFFVVLLFLIITENAFAAVLQVNSSAGGCRGDAASSYGTMQGAIDAATAGDTIIVCRNGTSVFIQPDTVVINKALNVFGNETDTKINASTLNTTVNVTADGTNISNFTVMHAFRTDTTAAIHIRAINVTIYNNNFSNNTIGVLIGFGGTAARVNISHNHFYNGTRAAIYILTSSNNTIHNNSIRNISSLYAGDGSLKLDTTATNNWISNNTIGFGYYGLYVDASSNNTFDNNTIFNSSQGGAYISSSNNNTFINNRIENSSSAGFWFQTAGSDNTIRNNTAFRNNLGSIDSHGGFYIDTGINSNNFSNNTATNNTQNGFHIVSSNTNVFLNNTACNNSLVGFRFATSSRNIFANNIGCRNFGTSEAQGAFVFLSSSYNNTIHNNSAYNNSNQGLYISASQDNNLTNNRLYDNAYGIYLTSSPYNIITNNSAYNNSLTGVYLTATSHINLTNNSAYNNSQYGFRFLLSSNNITLRSSIVENNSLVNVEFSSSSNNTITGGFVRGTGDGIVLSTVENTTVGNVSLNATNSVDFNNTGTTKNVTISTSAFNGSNATLSFNESAVNLRSVTYALTTPSTLTRTGIQINITNLSASLVTNVTFYYTQALIDGFNIDESTLKIYRYNGTWIDLSTVAGVTITLDTSANTISAANITSYSVFAVFGGELGSSSQAVLQKPVTLEDIPISCDASSTPNSITVKTLSGAGLNIISYCPACGSCVPSSTLGISGRASSSGVFTFVAPGTGNYEIRADSSAEGYKQSTYATLCCRVSSLPGLSPIFSIDQRTGDIIITVRDSVTGNPVENVEIVSDRGGASAITGAGGVAVIRGLPRGTEIKFSLGRPGYLDKKESYTTPKGTFSVRYSVNYITGEVTFTVTDSLSGQFVGGVEISLGSGTGGTLGRTGTGGMLLVRGLGSGLAHDIIFSYPGYNMYRGRYTIPARGSFSTSFSTNPRGDVVLELKDSVTGAPISGVDIIVSSGISGRTDASGRMILTGLVAGGTYSFSISKPGYTDLKEKYLVPNNCCEGFSTVTEIYCREVGTGDMKVYVADVPGNYPVPEAKITVSSFTAGISNAKTTSAAGKAVFSNLKAGSYSILIEKARYPSKEDGVSIRCSAADIEEQKRREAERAGGERTDAKFSCVLNSDCFINEKCTEGFCNMLVGVCGFPSEHKWTMYECGPENECKICNEGRVCLERKCMTATITGKNGNVGGNTTVSVKANGRPLANQKIEIKNPKNRIVLSKTNEKGEVAVLLEERGPYRIALLERDRVAASAIIRGIAPAVFSEFLKDPVLFIAEDAERSGLIIIFLAFLTALAFYFLVFRRRGARFKPRMKIEENTKDNVERKSEVMPEEPV